MHPDELELCSTHDLIAELMRRTTFQGVVIHAQDGAKSPNWNGERVFHAHFNSNLSREQASRLLDVVSAHMADGCV